jgi:hypothetical protein
MYYLWVLTRLFKAVTSVKVFTVSDFGGIEEKIEGDRRKCSISSVDLMDRVCTISSVTGVLTM